MEDYQDIKILFLWLIYMVFLKRVDEVLEMVRLTDSAHKNVSKYSLGMKQRLGIARAF